ncbi:MAG: sulfatase [Chthoniobacterales bacterium]|nr:sulfatase [Chthoniobacterales bacterium]
MRIPLINSVTIAMMATTPGLVVAAADTKPNVILILADDLGWSDTTLFGKTKLYQTPNIDRLAKRGMTFTRAYAASPLCSPTRASIMTGLNPARIGMTAPAGHEQDVRLKAGVPEQAAPNRKATDLISVTRLDTEYYTLGDMMKANGYVTGHFGKWHLGAEPYSPLEQGFDVDMPHWHGPGPAGMFVAPPWHYKTIKPRKPGEHIEDRMAEEAAAFIEKNKDRPFYLNFWQFSVHAPFNAKPELVEKYRKLIDPNDPQRSPTYAAMVESMDDAVGTLLDALDKNGLAGKTIVIFTSDNGGNMYDEVDGTTPTSNAPLRGGKATVYEGGIRVPWIVDWPGVVTPGSRSDVPVQTTDIYPTLLGMLGIAPQPGQTFDGTNIVPVLEGGTIPPRPIFTYFPHSPPVPDWLPPSVVVHDGDWKLIRLFHEGENGAHAWRLYNLKDDIGETKDLASATPEKVTELDAKIEAFLVDTKAVRPIPNPAFDPAKYNPEKIGIAPKKKPKNAPHKNKNPASKASNE